MKSVIEPLETLGESTKVTSGVNIYRPSSGQFLDAVWPYLCGVAFGFVVFFVATHRAVPPEIKDAFAAVASAAGLIAGFTLTAASILVSIGDRPYVREAKRAGVYGRLVSNLFTSMRWCIACLAVSIPAMLFHPDWKMNWYPAGLAVWGLLCGVATGTSSLRSLSTFSLLLRFVAKS